MYIIINHSTLTHYFLESAKPCRIASTTVLEHGYLSVPSSEDEAKDKETDTDYSSESADELLSSEISSNDGADHCPVSLLIENKLGSHITDMNFYYTIHIMIFIFSDDNMFQKTDRKYIVSESKLMELFSICPTCSFSSLCQIKKVLGTMIKIDQSSGMCGFQRTWESQEMIGAIPSGILSLSAAILFSGSY